MAILDRASEPSEISPNKPKPIATQLELLSEGLGTLRHEVNVLADRLMPVMDFSMTEPTAESVSQNDDEITGSALCVELIKRNVEIRKITRTIVALVNQLEV